MLFPCCPLRLSPSHKCPCEFCVLISWQLELRSEGISGTGHCCFLTAVTFQSLLSLGKESPHLGVAKGSLGTHFPWFWTQGMCLLLLSHCLLKCRCMEVEYYFHKVRREKGRRKAQLGCLRNNWICPAVGRVEVGNDNMPGSIFDGAFDSKFVRHIFLITLCSLSLF